LPGTDRLLSLANPYTTEIAPSPFARITLSLRDHRSGRFTLSDKAATQAQSGDNQRKYHGDLFHRSLLRMVQLIISQAMHIIFR
jgi:hypothetical protein